GVPCGESCVYIPCFTGIINCSCRDKVCYNN
uniref:Cyclotide hyen-E n=1 Tax=Pigea enneasperma TaxID=212266 RepID=CYHEE_PIGEN|nr:RecName: Full=Cyclotide hyen-E [Pigea enneasperma]